ncbi:MAG: DUF4080 domain-containing protein [Clostridiaceae bacterium]|jgi:radical SAM superfamily enzyme YgiQ (UPF0313 family)|nr:DUF4080 domain-containing protein [Clostridiaceae bacterium]
MKTLIVAINSKFIHSNLAVLYISAACTPECGEIKVVEFSINEPLLQIFSGIIRENPDIVAFSCYIWNIDMIRRLVDDLKKSNPNIVIIAGGPEVSFDDGDLPVGCVDYFVSGEGEEKFPFLLKRLNEGLPPDDTEKRWLGSYSAVTDLESLPSPYTAIKSMSMKNKIAYIEASRGCPFRCSYCISSVSRGVRYFPLSKVYQALEILVRSGSRIIKFVDRTFNANEARAMEIWQHIVQYQQQGIVFHFEIDPGLLTDNMLNRLESMPVGLVQLEAGIQSVHPETLSAVERPWSIDKAFAALQKLISFENIHVHVDLIAGLPHESYSGFLESFDRVMGIHAHQFQLGFLKLLRGSAIRAGANLYDYKYRAYPPYEIISNRDISCEEILKLKDIEACVELFYNSGRFALTLKVIGNHPKVKKPSDFFTSLASMMRRKGYLNRPVKANDLYGIMLAYLQQEFSFIWEEITSVMRYDYLRSLKNPSIPTCLKPKTLTAAPKHKRMERYRTVLEEVLPRLRNQAWDAVWKQIHIDDFIFPEEAGFPRKAVIAFDFGEISPVTGLAGAHLLENTGVEPDESP